MNAVLASLCSWVPAFRFAPAGMTHLAIQSENTTLSITMQFDVIKVSIHRMLIIVTLEKRIRLSSNSS
jgi:hypothetical protein